MPLETWKEYKAVIRSAPEGFRHLLSENTPVSKLQRSSIPTGPGVYFVYLNRSKRPHYIGSSKNLRRRVCDQLLKGRTHTYWYHMTDLWKKIRKRNRLRHVSKHWSMRYCSTSTEVEALALEYIAKVAFRPKYDELLEQYRSK